MGVPIQKLIYYSLLSVRGASAQCAGPQLSTAIAGGPLCDTLNTITDTLFARISSSQKERKPVAKHYKKRAI